MVKIKSKLYENRVGLFLFVLVSAVCFYSFGGFFRAVEDTTLSVYAADFSLGFLNKLLPGAVFNAIFKKTSLNLVSGYIQALIYVCFVFVSVFLQKFVYIFKESDRTKSFMISIFIAILFSVNTYQGNMFYLLDLHWLLSLFLFLFLLTKKQLYFFLPIPFLYAIITHNGAAMCYIPLFVLIVLAKIYYCDNKKEQLLLSIILIISFVSSVAMCFYFMLYDEVKGELIVDQMHELLRSRGVNSFEFYDSYFNPVYIEEKVKEVLGENLDANKENYIMYLIKRVKWHLKIANHKDWFIYLSVNLSAISLIVINLVKSAKSKISKVLNILAICLSIEVLLVGFLLSTDTERWIGHSVFCLLTYFVFIAIKDRALRNRVAAIIEKTSGSFIFLSLLICLTMCKK